jgi:cytochrome c-type biogenesis protein CcmH/NrfG
MEGAVAATPDDASVVAGLAQVYMDAGRADEAVEVYAHLGTLDNVAPMDVQRGLTLLVGRERYAKAVPLAEMLVENNPGEPNALSILGQCYAASGRVDEAIDVWERALEIRPGDSNLRQALSQAYRATGRAPRGN